MNGAYVIWDRLRIEPPVIPANAGIQSTAGARSMANNTSAL